MPTLQNSVSALETHALLRRQATEIVFSMQPNLTGLLELLKSSFVKFKVGLTEIEADSGESFHPGVQIQVAALVINCIAPYAAYCSAGLIIVLGNKPEITNVPSSSFIPTTIHCE